MLKPQGELALTNQVDDMLPSFGDDPVRGQVNAECDRQRVAAGDVNKAQRDNRYVELHGVDARRDLATGFASIKQCLDGADQRPRRSWYAHYRADELSLQQVLCQNHFDKGRRCRHVIEGKGGQRRDSCHRVAVQNVEPGLLAAQVVVVLERGLVEQLLALEIVVKHPDIASRALDDAVGAGAAQAVFAELHYSRFEDGFPRRLGVARASARCFLLVITVARVTHSASILHCANRQRIFLSHG
ncbi:hypothetical protein ASC96_30960 [Rhizobium sp. Root1204]|nr:hypothetical protein ASC96_30960 [Rhizobium sp. Root1204]